MRFEVPQFINIEDKIFGPLTFKQGLYIGGAIGIGIAAYKILPIIIAIPIIIVVAGIAWALGFYKLNNQPFIEVGQAFINYALKNKIYVWKKEIPKTSPVQPVQKQPVPPPNEIHKHTDIQTLARNLDILDKTGYN
jgi:hypothetical protein